MLGTCKERACLVYFIDKASSAITINTIHFKYCIKICLSTNNWLVKYAKPQNIKKIKGFFLN